ncbi:ATP-binding protein [Bowmanella dokdonensis]|uniref:Archaeal ATPase n=1 Tax=Bowmanella dokdonensis TaxID=751969 RepID=A0A939DN01_9ALTE|nr:hypothetical protein [Bowmanella dokdonensis]MBN7825222.1 hypothetical protein [Bowmanella dokdonensis]
MTESPHSNWHFPRTDLAKKILKGFQSGLADRITIFAPRKRGKTEFVQRDVAPMAKEQGILVVYVDFWRDKSSPSMAFATAVIAARREQESWFANVLSSSNLKASLKLLGGDLSLEVSPQRKHAEKQVTEAAFEELESTNKAVLLLLDEVQHLATNPAFSDFTASLRSFMTARADHKVKGIFTGSSQEGLAQLFKRTKAPFYNASSNIDFPDLGEEFVAFELEVFKRITGGVMLDKARAIELFDTMRRAPGGFTDLLKRMALEEVHDIDEGVARFSETLIEEENQQFKAAWDSMHPMDKALLILLAKGEQRGLYSDDYKSKLKSIYPGFDSTKSANSSIQNAVYRLKGPPLNAIYSAEHGVWRFTDPAFEQFVQDQEDTV